MNVKFLKNICAIVGCLDLFLAIMNLIIKQYGWALYSIILCWIMYECYKYWEGKDNALAE